MAVSSLIIEVKLNSPCVREQLVTRPRLNGMLDSGLKPGCRLILVSAPAGYGKSTMVASWLKGSSHDHAWLSLEESENEPFLFLTYLAMALSRVAPEFMAYIDSLSGISCLPSSAIVATELVNSLIPTPVPFIFALDDYHVITNPYVHDVFSFLLQHEPSGFHMLLITRSDPPFPLNRLRARSEMLEVRMNDLRFTLEEAGEFLGAMNLSLRDNAVLSCVERTEGWVAGLQLAALSMQGLSLDEVDGFLSAFGGSHRYIIDYLIDEVISRQAPSTRKFLRRTAVLDRFTASLCDMVTGCDDSGAVLRGIETNNLFLIPLDGEREWYRYHHLFSDSLQTLVGKAERAEVHIKAAEWYENRGNLPEAVKHALASGNMAEASRLIDAASPGMLARSERELITLRDWLEALPDDVLEANCGLFAGRSWIQYLTGRYREAEEFLNKIPAERREMLPECLQGRLLSLEAVMACNRGDDVCAAELAKEALKLITGEDDRMTRASTLNTLGRSLMRLNDSKGAEEAFIAADELNLAFPRSFISAANTSNLCMLLDLCGRRTEAETNCRRLYQTFLSDAGKPSFFGGILAVRLGIFAYEANELFEARTLLETGLELRHSMAYIEDVQGEETLALTLDTLGEREEAVKILIDARNLYESRSRHSPTDDLFTITAALAEIERRHNGPAATAHWVEQWRLTPHDIIYERRESGYMTYIRYLLNLNRADEAVFLTERMAKSAETGGRINRLISLYVLLSLAYEALGRRNEALASISQAVAYAAPEGYVRAFLDQGTGIVKLLPLIRDTSPAFVERLEMLFSPPECTSVVTGGGLPETLTERECDLLGLLAGGLSNEDISHRLYISLNTTKWHLKNIFGKLAVGNRVQAAAKAKELGLGVHTESAMLRIPR